MKNIATLWDAEDVQSVPYRSRTKGSGNPRLLRDDIYRSIRHSILTCEYAPGQELRAQVLAEFYHVSISPTRDALLRLAQENLVTVLPRQGYRVNPISTSDGEEICALRMLIEPACAVAAAHADDTALRRLDIFRNFFYPDLERPKFVAYNKAFHRAITGLSGNKRLSVIAMDIIEQFERLVHASVRVSTPDAIRRMCGEHDEIIDALQAHNPERAFKLSYQHVQRANERIATIALVPLWTESGSPGDQRDNDLSMEFHRSFSCETGDPHPTPERATPGRPSS